MSLIYLDYNRTTPIAPSVLEAMKPFWSTYFLLPSQEHPYAQAVSEALENAREGVGQLVGCEPFELVFTGGGTESDNLAIRGLSGHLAPGHLLVGELEADAVLAAARSLESAGWQVELVPVGTDGVIDPDRLASMIRSDTRLACVQLANPILGTLQPVRQIADVCHGRGVLVHCDASAAFGKIAVSAHQLRVDTLSLNGHNFFGPKGTGALYVRRGLELNPIVFGEPREMGLRPGDENVPACVGLGAAARLAAQYSADAPAGLAELRDRFVSGIQDALSPQPLVLGGEASSLPNTAAIELPVEARRVLKLARQVAVASSLSDSPPDQVARALRAMGRTDLQIGRTISVSVGWTTTRDQIDSAVSHLADACDAVAAP